MMILPNNQRPRFAERLNQGIRESIPVAQNFLDQLQQKKQIEAENQKLSQLGYDVGGISSKEGRQAVFENINRERQAKLAHENRLAELSQENQIKDRMATEKETKANNEKLAPYKTALNAIASMRQILKRGNLGLLSGAKGIFHPKTREDRAKYVQLGKTLISQVSPIIIRNKTEFETFAHDLYDPNNTDDKNKAILESVEQIIRDNMKPYLNGSEEKEEPKRNKRALTVFLE